MPAQSPPWYITRDGQQHGPVADAELKKLVDDGQLQATDFLWRQDFTEWRPATVLFPQLEPATRENVVEEQRETRRQTAQSVRRPATQVRTNRMAGTDDGATEEQSVIWRRRIVIALGALCCAAAIGAAIISMASSLVWALSSKCLATRAIRSIYFQ